MSKLLPISIGIAGAGSIGIVGLVAFKPWQSNSKDEVINPIKEKYSIALLNKEGDEAIWEKKYTALGTYSPHNKILKDAASKKAGDNPNEEEIKRLLKLGCSEIYSASEDDSSKSDTNRWDTVLTSLKGHEVSTKWELNGTLSALREEIKNDNTTFSQEKRAKLRDWCNLIKVEIFKGGTSSEFKSQEEFCKWT